MATFNVPTRDEVSENNKFIFDSLEKGIGFVPNIYAVYAYSDTALGDYLAFQNRKTSLTGKEKEIVNLVVSEVNGCAYCKSAHTAVGKMNGFSDDQVLEIRSGKASFDPKLDALARFVKDAAVNRSQSSAELVGNLIAAGYTKENLVDTIMVIGDKTVSNYLHGATQVAIDFPAVPELETELA